MKCTRRWTTAVYVYRRFNRKLQRNHRGHPGFEGFEKFCGYFEYRYSLMSFQPTPTLLPHSSVKAQKCYSIRRDRCLAIMGTISELKQQLDGIVPSHSDINAEAKEEWVKTTQLFTALSSKIAKFPVNIPVGGKLFAHAKRKHTTCQYCWRPKPALGGIASHFQFVANSQR